MDDFAVVLDARSTSLKFCVFGTHPKDGWQLETRGLVEGIGASPRFTVMDVAGRILGEQRIDTEVHEGRSAVDFVTKWLRFRYGRARVIGVGHRVVHGGTRYTGPTLVTPEVMKELRGLVHLAPDRQLHNLMAIEAISERFPGVPQVACFDTSFHRTNSEVAAIVPLPQEIRRRGVQRYGFHGLAYEYIAAVLPKVAPEIASGRVIVAHLGDGASMCALKNGKSADSTFGFTALDGLCAGTRSGTVDPGVILYLLQELKLSAAEIDAMLTQQSGLLGISGATHDMRALLASADPAARLAVSYFVYRAAKEIGALAAVLGGIDGLVFIANNGSNAAEVRKRICEASAWLGIALDRSANARKGPRISAAGSKVSAWVIPTNEEMMIVHHTGMVLGLLAAPI